MAGSLILGLLDDQLICSIHDGTIVQPRELNCRHSFCQRCLVNLVERSGEERLRCPTCRRVTVLPDEGVAGLETPQDITDLLRARNGIMDEPAPKPNILQPPQELQLRLVMFLLDQNNEFSTTDLGGFPQHLHKLLSRGTSPLLQLLLLLTHTIRRIPMKMFSVTPSIDHAFNPCLFSHHLCRRMFPYFVEWVEEMRCIINCQMMTCLTNALKHGTLRSTGIIQARYTS